MRLASVTRLAVLAGLFFFISTPVLAQETTVNFSWTPATVKVGETMYFTDESHEGPRTGSKLSWYWSFGDGTISPAQNVAKIYGSPGKFDVTLTVNYANLGPLSATKTVTITGDALKAAFSWSPARPLVNQGVQFYDNSTGEPASWFWQFGDGSSTTARNPVHVFSRRGNYVISLRVTKGSQMHMLLKQVNVYDPGPSVVAKFAWSPTTPAAKQPVTFYDRSEGRPTSWAWSMGDGIVKYQQSPGHTYANPGVYAVTLTVSDGGQPSTTTQYVTVASAPKSEPIATFNFSPQVGVVGQPVSFFDTSIGTPTQWLWEFGDGTTSTARNPTHAFPFAAGGFRVSLTATNADGSSTTVRSVEVKSAGKAPEASFWISPTAPVQGQTVTFYDSSKNDPTSLTWSIDGIRYNGKTATRTYTGSGTSAVTLTATNVYGTSSASKTITIAPLAQQLDANFTYSPARVVSGKPVTFNSTSIGSPNEFTWYFGDGDTASSASATHTFLSAGTYNVSLAVSRADGDNDTVLKSITVNPGDKPRASFTVLPSPSRVGQAVSLTDSSGNAPDAWRWDVDGRFVSTDRNTTFTFSEAGTHTVMLTASNSEGRDSLTRAIRVDPPPLPPGPEIYSVRSRYGRCFVSSFPISNDLTAWVNWKGETPGQLQYSINGGSPSSVAATKDGGTIPLQTSALTGGGNATSPFRNVVTTTAQNTAGSKSTPLQLELFGYPKPSWLVSQYSRYQYEADRATLLVGRAFPEQPWEGGEITMPEKVPFFGGKKYGIKKVQATYEYQLRSDCTAASSMKGEGGFGLDKWALAMNLHGGSEIALTPTQGIVERKGLFGLEVAGTVEGEVKFGDALNAIYPGAGAICGYQVAKRVCEVMAVKTEIKVAGGGDLSWTSDDKGMHYADSVIYLGPEAKVSLAAKVTDSINAEVFGGGKFGFTFGSPLGDLPFLRKFEFAFETGYQYKFYLMNSGNKVAILCSSERTQPITCGYSGGSLTGISSPSGIPLNVIPPERHAPSGSITSDAGENELFTLSAPSATTTPSGIVAVYLYENASASNLLQRTDVHYVTRTATGWSAPRAIASDDRGEFAPKVAARSDGKAIAVWQRTKSATLTPDDVKTLGDLPKLHAQMEIATATFDPVAGTWSAVEMLTSNDVIDYAARLLPLSDGSVWAVWLRDDSNTAFGSATQPLKLVARKLTGTTWGTEQTLATGFAGADTIDVAVRGTDAIVAWARDKDGDTATPNDTELSYVTLASGTWAAAKDLTSDTVADVYPVPLYLASGAARMTWIKNGNLVWQAIDGSSPSVIFDGGNELGLASRIIARAPSGAVAMVWTERLGGTPDVLASIYDSAAGAWSAPVALTRTEDLESSASAFLSDDRELTAVALATRVSYGNDTAIIDGKTVTIPGVSSMGASDLLFVAKTLQVDVAALPGGITTSTLTPQDGERVTLRVAIVNRGELPVRDVPWKLVSGRGTTGATAASGTVAGLWAGGEQRSIDVPVAFTTGMQDLTFVLDPDAATGDVATANNISYFGFANRPPIACMQLSRIVGLAPMAVTFDGSCSSDSEGSITGYAWTFGDGESAYGATASHTFAAAGTYAVTLTVNDDSGGSTAKTVSIFVETTADLRVPSTAMSLNVPVAGRTSGAAGTFFVSDATLFNADAGEELGVDAVYMPDGRSDFYYFAATVPPLQLLDMPDIVARSFSAPAGAGWLRFDLSHSRAVAMTRSYNKQPNGTAGTAVPAVAMSDATASGSRRVFLQDWRTGYRVNVGLAEVGGEDSDVTFTAYDAKGASLGSRTYHLSAFSHSQVNGEALFQSAGRIEASVDGGTVIPYLTTVDGKTGDAVYQAGVQSSAIAAGERWLIPTVARVTGDASTKWRTDVRVFNADASTRDVTFTLVTATGSYTKTLPFSAGETKAWDDVVTSLFTDVQGEMSGVLFVESAGSVFATSRTYNETPNGTYGLTIPARRKSDLPVSGNVLQLVHLRSDSAFRCNLGITAFDDSGATIRVRAYDVTGTLLGEKEYGVGARQNRQFNRIFTDLGITASLSAARIEAEVLSGTPYVYVSVVDNQTGDGTFIEALK